MAIEAIKGVINVPTQTTTGTKSVTTEKTFKTEEIKFQQMDNRDKSASAPVETTRKGERDLPLEQEQEQANNEQIRKAVEGLNKKMSHSEAIYGIHEDTNRVTIKIVDRNTKEVIKELPPEKTLDMIAKVWEIAGIMVDEKR